MAEYMSTVANSDAELVVGSLAGDRNAFGQIVSRYQTLVCSLAMLNLFWRSWVSDPEMLGPEDSHYFHPVLLVLNFLVIVFYGSLELATWLIWRFATATKRKE